MDLHSFETAGYAPQRQITDGAAYERGCPERKALRTGVEKCLKVRRIIRDAAPGKILGALNCGPFGLAPRQHVS